MTPEFLKFFLLALFIILQAPTGASLQSVRDELTQLQKTHGLSLILVDDIVQVMIPRGPVLAKQIRLPEGGTGGEISTDGTEIAFILSRGVGSHLAISLIDGANVREYDSIETASQYMCWSHDKSMLVLQGRTFKKTPNLESALAAREHQAVPVLTIVDLHSGTAQQIAEGSVTSECWSPDDKQVVYEADRDVRVYDVVTKRSQTLSDGQHPTWSPDGTQIAFMRDDGTTLFLRPALSRLVCSRNFSRSLVRFGHRTHDSWSTPINIMSGSFLPSLWSLCNRSLRGSRSRHCYANKLDRPREHVRFADFPGLVPSDVHRC